MLIKTLKLRDVEVGQVFMWGNALYLRMPAHCFRPPFSDNIPVYCLNDNRISHFEYDSTETVTPVNVEVVCK